MKNTKITSILSALLLICSTASCKDNTSNIISESSETSPKTEVTENIDVGLPDIPKPENPSSSNVVRIAAIEDQFVYSAAYNYLQENPDKEFDLIKFSSQNYEDRFDELTQMLITGEELDLIVAPQEYIPTLIDTGNMTNMYSLIEQYDGFKKEDILPNVLEGFEENGKLYSLSPTLIIHTAAAKTKHVGEGAENWTPQQAIELYQSLPEDVAFLYNPAYEYKLSDYMMKKASRSAISYSSNSCNFGGEFVEVLDFVSQIPDETLNTVNFEEMSMEEAAILHNEISNTLRNDEAIVSEITFNGLNKSMIWNLLVNFGGEDITFVGFPSVDGHGVVTQAEQPFVIPDSSTKKELTWDFVNYLMTEQVEFTSGIPVLKTQINNIISNADPNDSTSIRRTIEEGGISCAFTDEQLTELVNYISSIKVEPYYSPGIESIIKEEYSAVLDGDRSPQDCADILQNRISIYFAEQS